MEDNCDKYDLSSAMVLKLRELVQMQLADELNSLLGMSFKYYFDWSESCIEGHDGMFLDVSLENLKPRLDVLYSERRFLAGLLG